ncbi:MAG TPA: 2-oxo-4-hydroxy-4-carboxy-5-ureidoimidazoline decarboxylase [Candidatus Dormibacteraeota bacterium]|nr:2-oxo-4-hydroxy-4-carboxy-5-ureidoimidazoline decarboxylase [Candidatus Dormibacteraeota bacterium]
MPEKEAAECLYKCFANRRWAAEVCSRRPYTDAQAFLTAAWVALSGLPDDDWMAAFKAHPRIGERGGDAPESSQHEQSRAMQSGTVTLAALEAENRQYEERFGHVFLIRAGGRSGEEILSELRRRMRNDPVTELGEARRELAQIARGRLSELVS